MSSPEWITDSTGKITGYKTQGGADTVFPFNPIRYIEKYLRAGTNTINLEFRPKNKIFCVSNYGVQSAYYDVKTGSINNGTTSGAGIAFSITTVNNDTVILQVKNNINVWILYY